MDILVDYHTFDYTLEEIKRQIAVERYDDYYQTLPSDINIEDDKNHGVPLMNKMFYEMFLSFKAIPSWRHYCEAYINRYCKQIHKDNYTFILDNQRYQYVFKKQALEKKLIRAYMSFLKELYVLYWFYDRGLTTAYYSLEKDILGFDIVVTNKFNHMFGIKIYSNTYNANKFAKIKRNERNHLPEHSTGIAIRAGIHKDRGPRLGDTYVFPDRLLNSVYHYIMNDIQKDIIL